MRRYDIGGGSNPGGPAISISLPGVENHDTERRRQIALKALKDRLSKSEQSTESTNWPSLEDESKSETKIDSDTNKESVAAAITTPNVAVKIDIEEPTSTDLIDVSDKKPLLQDDN